MNRRVLVFGPYPPMPGPEAAATLADVRQLLGEGAEVKVVSPRPSAAHHHADLRTPAGSLRLARWAGGADAALLRLDAAVVTAPAGRRQALRGVALGLALRRAGSATVHLDSLGRPPDPRFVRLVLGGAERVVVASAADGQALRAAGLPGDRVVVEEIPPGPPPAAGAQGTAGSAASAEWHLGPHPSREELQAEIRRRAAAGRGGVGAAGGRLPAEAAGAGALRLLHPIGPAPAHSAKPGLGLVKRVVQRLIGFQVNPIIEHLNLLHRSTLEAIEALRGEHAQRGDERGDARSS